MLERASIPWLELLRLFARLRRKRIRSYSFTRKVFGLHSPSGENGFLPATSPSMEIHSMGVRHYFQEVRKSILVLGLLNCTLALVSTSVATVATRQDCPRKVAAAANMITAAACLRLLWMLGPMLERASIPWLELLRLFARLRRKRIRSYSFTRKVFGLHSPSGENGFLPATSPSMEIHSMGVRHYFQEVRKSILVLGLLNCTLALVSTSVATVATRQDCPRKVAAAANMITAAACLRLLWMLGMGFIQAVTATAMHDNPSVAMVQPLRSKRRKWYKVWLWWSRVGFLVTAVQGVGALCFAFVIATISAKGFAYRFSCGGVADPGFGLWLVVTPVLAWAIAVAQCCVGSDVIAWRSLYHNHGDAWRAHYREMFDYGIREFLCCLGRRQYLSQSDKDEVDIVAALIGELLEYRAGGASHLEVAAGIALLREQKVESLASDDGGAVPEELLSEASLLHPYAVAAYTGFLLDFCQHPFTWICVWLRRQGILSFWNRNRRPILEGDNWWRGNAAAFLRHAQLPPDALLQGRVSQEKSRETVYFVVVLHHLKKVVVAVRGTETPEDMLIDGLADRECKLSDSDLLGLLKGDGIPDQVKKQVQDSMPHYCHKGVINAARELSMKLDNLAEDESEEQALDDCAPCTEIGDSEVSRLGRRQGLLTGLLGSGGKYEGYSLRLVGHSLGGSIATLTAIRLYKRYPDLRVYTYGVLPCVDSVTADACASFVTSVIYNDEFSSRLSVASIMRLRASALGALSSNSESSNSAWFLLGSSEETKSSDSSGERRPECLAEISHNRDSERNSPTSDQLLEQWRKEMASNTRRDNEEKSLLAEQLHSAREDECSVTCAVADEHPYPQVFKEHELLPNGMPTDLGSELQDVWPEEMYVPGLIIHLVKEMEPSEQSTVQTFCHGMGCVEESEAQYSAVLKDRKSFRDIVVSPNMFIDHGPWRCQRAMNEVLKKWRRIPSNAASVSHELV